MKNIIENNFDIERSVSGNNLRLTGFKEKILSSKNYLIELGDDCYNNIKHIYKQYSGGFTPPELRR